MTTPKPGAPPAGTHECPADGCERPVPSDQLACAPHWRMVSSPTQRQVWTAYRYGTFTQHVDAMAKAVREINAAIANTARQRQDSTR